jgi:autotransporter-associated beta strand protein
MNRSTSSTGRRAVVGLLVIAGLLGLVTPAAAQTTYTWTGGGGSGAWSDGNNWGGTPPSASLTQSFIQFSGTTNTATVLDLLQGTTGGGTFNVAGVTFDSTAGSFSIAPTGTNVTSLGLGASGITVQSNANQSISAPIVLGLNQTWANTGTGTLSVGGPVNAGSTTLTLGGTGAVQLSGNITGGTLAVTGTGTYTLSGNNTLTGLNISAGTTVINKTGTANPLGTGPVALSGGTLAFKSFGNPVGLTAGSFNQDVITSANEYTTTPYGTTAAVDGATGNGSFVFYETGTGGQNTSGLPSSGRFVSANNPAVTYQLQGFTGNNVLLLGNANQTGTLTLSSPAKFQSLSFLTVGGSGSPTYSFTLNFQEGGSTTVTGFTAPDWFNGANPVIVLNGRLNRNNGTFDSLGSGNPRMYNQDYTLSAVDQGKTVTSIDFTYTGGTGSTLDIFGLSGVLAAGAQTYTNAVTVSSNSTVEATNVGTVSLGPLSINGSTLNLTGAGGGAGVTFGATTLTGNPTFSTAGGVTLTLGALADGGTARILTKSGAGTLTLGTAASSFVAGSQVNITAGTLNVAAAGAIGTGAAVTLSPGATLNTTVDLTVKSLAGLGGSVNLNTNTLTVNGGGASTFGGQLSNGNLTVAGSGTVLSLSGPNSPAAVSIQSGAKLVATTPAALGTNTVTLANNATLTVSGLPTSMSGFNNGIGWNLQGNDVAPTATATALTITNAVGGQAHTAWAQTQVPVGPFTVSFRYSQSNNTAPADGVTFTIQSQSGTAIGNPGGSLGYQGITNSGAFALNIFDGAGGGRGYSVVVNGAAPAPFTSVSPINLLTAQTGNEVTVTLAYDGTNISGQLTQGSNTFTVPATAFDLSAVGPVAFIGFTGGTGGSVAAQTIDNFSFSTQPGTAVYTAPVTVAPGASATVNVAGTATAAPRASLGALTMGSGSTLTVGAEPGTPTNLPYTLGFASATLNGAVTFVVANNGTGTGTLILPGVTGSGGSLTKAGAGTLVLTGAGTYDGGTTVSAGSLLVRNQASTDSATGTGSVNVAAGATIGGTGRVAPATNGSITLANGARLLLDANASESLRMSTSGSGALILGTSTTPGAAAVVALKLTATGSPAAANSGGSTLGTLPNPTNHGFVTTDGTVSLTSGLTFEIDGTGLMFTVGQTYSYQIGQLNGWPGGQQTLSNPAGFSTIGFAATGLSATVTSAGAVFVNFTAAPVPEPATVLALAAAGLGVVVGVRRLRRTGAAVSPAAAACC